MDKTLGTRISALRKERGLTQEQATALLAIPLAKYQRMEEGKVRMSLEILGKIAAAYGVEVSEITSALDFLPDSSATFRAAGEALEEREGGRRVAEMLDLFYANKRMYERLQQR